MSAPASTRSGWRRALVVLVLAGLVMLVARVLPFSSWIVPFSEWIRSQGLLGQLAFVVVYVLATVLFVPASLLTIGAGAVFGLWLGVALVSAGSTIGAMVAFRLARGALRHRVAAAMANRPRFAALDRAVARRGASIVFLVRLSPIFPFALVNYAFGLTAVSTRAYALASWLGMLPATVAYVYLGTAGRAVLEGGSRWIAHAIAALATIGVTAVITRQASRAIREAGLEVDGDQSSVTGSPPSSSPSKQPTGSAVTTPTKASSPPS